MFSFYTDVRQYGNRMLVRAVENNRKVSYEVKYKPYLFIPSKKNNSEYSTVFGDKVDKIEFESIKEAKNFVERYKDVENFEFYGMTQFVYPFLNDTFPGEILYDREFINVISIDIETMSDGGFPDIKTANKEITAITLSDGKKFVFLSVKEYIPHIDNIKVIRCIDEKELLAKFVEEWNKLDPDIITGWNVEAFDIPYLINRINVVLGEEWSKRLSPWGFIREDSRKGSFGGEDIQTYDIFGISVMDYMLIYKKWTLTTQESYRLEHIAQVELGEGKTDYSEYGSLHGLYMKNFQLYAEYNIRDTEIINQLDEKLKLMDLVLALAYDSKLNYSDAYTSVRMWDVIIHNYLMNHKMVVPQYKYDGNPFEFVGGYVKNPQVGKHDWVCSFDLNSLYPHLIMQYNISPDTYKGSIPLGTRDIGELIDDVFKSNSEKNNIVLEYLLENNYTVTPNGCLWTREKQGFLSALMEKVYNDRSAFKKKMLEYQQKYQDTKDVSYLKESNRFDLIQMAKKIQLNSAYGALGNEYFRWFNPKYAESITLGGQLSIRWIEVHVNNFINKNMKTKDIDYVIASDTDSIYLRLDGIVKLGYTEIPSDEEVVKYLDKVCSKLLEPFIKKSYEELAHNVNAYSQKMRMKREAIASKGIWTGKKHYVLNVFNNEGVQYAQPKIKIMGIEAVRSSTPHACRESIKESIYIILNKTEDDLIEYVEKFREKFNKMDFEQVASPRSLSGMAEYRISSKEWKKGTPIAVRGAFVFNRMIEENKLDHVIPKLKDGDKIKFCYMKLPNPGRQNILSCLDGLPKEFSYMKEYIDHDLQFEKTFLSPLKNITNVIGWNVEYISTLKSFFC
jgi:DNA polymerase elongation subunit (family B)